MHAVPNLYPWKSPKRHNPKLLAVQALAVGANPRRGPRLASEVHAETNRPLVEDDFSVQVTVSFERANDGDNIGGRYIQPVKGID